MTSGETYMYGNSYEFFIRRAFKCERGKHGAETSLFKYLLDSEVDRNFLSQPYEKQLKQVKVYLDKAVDKFLTRKPTDTERIGLQQIKSRIEYSHSAMELVDIISDALEITQRYRDL